MVKGLDITDNESAIRDQNTKQVVIIAIISPQWLAFVSRLVLKDNFECIDSIYRDQLLI